jgi:hypothetical protein
MRFYNFAILITFLIVPVRVNAAVLYAAGGQGGLHGGSGELYIIDPTNGATITDIGPLNDSTGRNFPMTGLAFDPVSGVLYGSSAAGNPDTSTRDQLVTINPATGLVTPIGDFGLGDGTSMTDIAFDPNTHVLYGLPSVGGASLYTINKSNAQVTLVGSSGFTATNGGGIAVNSSSVIYATPLSDMFGTYNATTGAFTNIVAPTLPNGRGFGALKFNGNTLYGIEVGVASHLVTIDTTTGAVTDLGATTATKLDGLAFMPAASLAGDYNHDGKVTAADYVIWRNGGSPNPNSPADFTTWKANFGASAGSGAGLSSAAVPEPSLLLLIAMTSLSILNRRAKSE